MLRSPPRPHPRHDKGHFAGVFRVIGDASVGISQSLGIRKNWVDSEWVQQPKIGGMEFDTDFNQLRGEELRAPLA